MREKVQRTEKISFSERHLDDWRRSSGTRAAWCRGGKDLKGIGSHHLFNRHANIIHKVK